MGSDEARRLQMLEKENVRLKKIVSDQALDVAILKDVNSKNLIPVKRKAAVQYVMNAHEVSERRACWVLSVNRAAFRYEPVLLPDEDALSVRIS